MDYTTYKSLFDTILTNPHPVYPYDNPAYLDYTRLNQSRMKRWDKQLSLDNTLISRVQNISCPQHWIILTEPWCGDAAHILPFLIRMTTYNPFISYELQLRDSEPFLIEDYLTMGAKSIPKLIARNEPGKDLFTWGPRPAGAAELMKEMKAAEADFEAIKIALQNWYNQDKGASLCRELSALL